MKAFVLTHYGGPEATQLRAIARPVPRTGEVLVRVKAAGLNPVDFKTREGKLKPILSYRLPVVMGNELAGIVESVGPGVKDFAPGDRVFARTSKDAMGALARFATLPEDVVAPIPSGLDYNGAAALPLAGLTALQALRDEMRLGPDSRVLITGGAGGVGTLAIQIAKWLGAHVVTTASPGGRALVEQLGADETVDYTTQSLEEHVGEVDGAFDLIGGDTLKRVFGVVKKGGLVVSVAGLPEPQTARKDLHRGLGLAAIFWFASLPLRIRARLNGVRYRFLFMHPSSSELSELGELVVQNHLKPIVDRVFDFDGITVAFSYLEAGHAKGKVVVRIDDLD